MRRRILSLMFALGLGQGLAGCATLEHGTLDDVSVVTEPPGADVTASTGTNCVSPCTVSGARQENFAITVAKRGFVAQTVVSEAKADVAAIAAASALTPTADALGRVIDVQDGSHYTHVPKAVVVKLEPAP